MNKKNHKIGAIICFNAIMAFIFAILVKFISVYSLLLIYFLTGKIGISASNESILIFFFGIWIVLNQTKIAQNA